MTILQSLNTFYDRLDARGRQRGIEEVPQRGYAKVGLAFAIPIAPDGSVQQAIDLRDKSGNRPIAVDRLVPKLRDHNNSGKDPFLFWDNTGYALGVVKKEMKRGSPQELFECFRDANLKATEGCQSPELQAFQKFLRTWTTATFEQLAIDPADLDANVVFRFIGSGQLIHQTDEARSIWAKHCAPNGDQRLCLVTGVKLTQARLHPKFPPLEANGSKGPIVSFNADAFESYGKSQGANAPVSEEAAFRYGAALNWLLDRDNSRSLRLGETTVVYWADAKDIDESLATAAEDNLGQALDPPDGIPNLYTGEDDDEEDANRDHDTDDSARIGAELGGIRDLRRAPDGSIIPPDTRMHILGLSPNAGRIAVRFWL
ncbi:MAG: type I-C CRISPR-associated protein Cas8c/Csd1, partial [Alphaproteobacteria bacterium]|nr:type I-C CRISPR-associated protein Cas8c/Csd1 [Alphaproteobacteria bacterium]